MGVLILTKEYFSDCLEFVFSIVNMMRWGRTFYFLLVCVLMIHQTNGVIFRLNDTEFERMPPITLIDDYEKCMYDPEPLYCTTELELVSDEPSELLDLIQNYSERQLTHHNYSSLYRGVCVTRSCGLSKEATLLDRNKTLEGCLNNTIWNEYHLKTRLTTTPICYPTDKNNLEIDMIDIFVAIICLFIITLNIAATSYDLNCTQKSKSKGLDLLLAFSIPRNWSRLWQSGNGSKPDVERLKGIDGLRAMMMIFILMGHCVFPFTISISNTRELEEAYYNLPCHFLINAMYVVEYFFVMSGLLLSYNMESSAEKKKLKWTTIPSHIFKRWLRLTPTFAIVLAITATWLRFMGSGPLWQVNELKEITDCRRYWLWNLMYMANYKDGSHCLPQSWYLAADMHLYSLSVIILVLVTNNYWRKIVLSTALLIGIITPAIPTYMYNLDTLLNLSPQPLRNYATNDPSFDFLYKRSHTNIANYVIGLIGGIYLYRLQKSKFVLEKYRKYLILYWASVPVGIGIIVFNKVFFDDGPQVSVYFRMLFQMFARPILALLFVGLVFGMVFKLEGVYRGICEWEGWVWIARVSYSAYTSHGTIYRLLIGNSTSLLKFSALSIVPVLGLLLIALVFATVFWLILEGPMIQVVKVCFDSPTKDYSEAKFDSKKE